MLKIIKERTTHTEVEYAIEFTAVVQSVRSRAPSTRVLEGITS